MTKDYSHQFVEHAITIGALELLPAGRKLKSGRISPYFFNSGLYTKGSSLQQLAEAYAKAIVSNWSRIEPEVIFGPAYKGITLASAVAVELSKLGFDIEYAYNRKEQKLHGDGGLIVGNISGKKVLMIDDVITDGATKDEAMGVVKNHNGSVTGLIIAFDRCERTSEGDLSAAQTFEQRYQVPVLAIANTLDLTEYLSRVDVTLPTDIDKNSIIRQIVAYGVEYGAV